MYVFLTFCRVLFSTDESKFFSSVSFLHLVTLTNRLRGALLLGHGRNGALPISAMPFISASRLSWWWVWTANDENGSAVCRKYREHTKPAMNPISNVANTHIIINRPMTSPNEITGISEIFSLVPVGIKKKKTLVS